jgi:hypothetical protein
VAVHLALQLVVSLENARDQKAAESVSWLELAASLDAELDVRTDLALVAWLEMELAW